MSRKESNRAYYAKNHEVLIIQSKDKRNAEKVKKKGKETMLKVTDLLRVNPRIMRKQIYKASDLKRILMT